MYHTADERPGRCLTVLLFWVDGCLLFVVFVFKAFFCFGFNCRNGRQKCTFTEVRFLLLRSVKWYATNHFFSTLSTCLIRGIVISERPVTDDAPHWGVIAPCIDVSAIVHRHHVDIIWTFLPERCLSVVWDQVEQRLVLLMRVAVYSWREICLIQRLFTSCLLCDETTGQESRLAWGFNRYRKSYIHSAISGGT